MPNWKYWIAFIVVLIAVNLFWFAGFRYAYRRYSEERAHKELIERALIHGVIQKCGGDETIVIRIEE